MDTNSLLCDEMKERYEIGHYNEAFNQPAILLPKPKKSKGEKKTVPPVPLTREERRQSKSQERKLRKLVVSGVMKPSFFYRVERQN